MAVIASIGAGDMARIFTGCGRPVMAGIASARYSGMVRSGPGPAGGVAS